MNTISEQYLDEARQYRGSGDERAWEMADWVKSVLVRVDEERHGLRSGDRTRIFKELAIAMGVSRASVSDLCQLAETYEPGARAQFADVLTIGHYREAMRCKETDPILLLHEAVETADEWGGQIMPVDVLRQIVRKRNQLIEPAKGQQELYKLCLDRIAKYVGDAMDYCPDRDRGQLASMAEWLQGVNA